MRCNALRILFVGTWVLTLGIPAVAVEPPVDGKPAAKSFTEAATEARKTGQPLVVFGMSPGCSRCAALQQGLETNPEVKQLLAQYVTAEVPFGGREFTAIFKKIVAQDKSFNQAIGAPSVFIFTSKGKAVYAGPNNPNGMAAGDEFEQLLTTGLEKNDGKRGAASAANAASLKTSEPTEARVWKDKSGKFSVTATLVSFDGKTARLRKSDGKTISVALDALSPEDQRVLRETKR
jgi:hypothetical protein